MNARNADEDGCWIIADYALGPMPQSKMYWYLDRYADRLTAQSAKTRSGTVVYGEGYWWLFTIDTQGWEPMRKGVRVAVIGPLPVVAGVNYSATYLDSDMAPGVRSAVHRHSGPEAWYTFTGETCLETPTGKHLEKAGQGSLIVPEGTKMQLTATGREKRRSFALILHRSSEPPTRMVADWHPKRLCK